MFVQVLLLIATLFIIYYFYGENRTKLPPGPSFHLPIVGHLPFLGDNPAKTFLKWSKIYGPILHVRLGSFHAVVINDGQLIRKAFNLNSFSGRPQIKVIDESTRNRKGFMFSDGPKSVEQRKFTQRLLKDFGYGTNSMESRILAQIPSLLEIFEDHLSKPLNVKHTFTHNNLNVLWSIVAGDVFDKNDKDFQQLAKNLSEGGSMDTVIEKLTFFLKFIPVLFPELSGFNKKVRGVEAVQKYLDSVIKEHQSRKVTDQPKDLIDAYLDEIEKTSNPQSAFFAAHGNITIAMQDLFLAGVETTTTTLEWALFYLAKYPNVQEKLQKEIDMVLGNKSLPSSQDRQKLPYVEAVIQEVFRISSIVPLSLFHSTLEDTEFNGYSIDKDTIVLGNLFAVHHDKDIWGDPEVFRPERFLDEDGHFSKSDAVVAFSCGKRSCIGEQLAKLQLFLYIVSIFQVFNVKPVGQLPSENGVFGLTITVHPFQVLVSKRE